jgi:hypothetical protein
MFKHLQFTLIGAAFWAFGLGIGFGVVALCKLPYGPHVLGTVAIVTVCWLIGYTVTD